MLLVGLVRTALSYSVLAQRLDQLRFPMQMPYPSSARTVLAHRLPSTVPTASAARTGRTASTAASVALVLAVTLALGACASKPPASDKAAAAAAGTGAQVIGPTGLRGVLGALAPYRITIQQGNFVSSEMLAQLKVGMTKDQVRFALGTPLLNDIFHAQRWDYIFRLQRGNGEVTTSRVTVFFTDDKVATFQGGDLPTEADYLSRIAGASPISKELPTLVPVRTAPSAPAPK
jgi:outer membrane protein assembly factor BamE